MTGSVTRPRAMTFVPMGNSTGMPAVDADGLFRRDEADDESLSAEAALTEGLQQLSIGLAARKDFAVFSGDELPPISLLELGVRNDLDGDLWFHESSPLG